MAPPRLLSLEYVVDDLDRALELLVDLLGLELIDRHPHPALDAEVVTLDLGTVVLTLLHPTAVGDRPAVSAVACNLAQLLVEVDEPIEQLNERLAERGAGVVVDGPTMSHLSAQTTASVFGIAPSMLFTSSVADTASEVEPPT